MASNGEGQAQGRPGQERQTKEFIFQELAFGREHLFMDEADLRYCTVCHRREDNHNVRHAFTAPGDRLDVAETFAKPSERPPRHTMPDEQLPSLTGALSVPFDPILRLALIDKGIITPDDLADAQRKMSAMNAEVLGDGNGPR